MMRRWGFIAVLAMLLLMLSACGDSLSRFAEKNAGEAMTQFKDDVGSDVDVQAVRWFAFEIEAGDQSDGSFMSVRTVYYHITYEVNDMERAIIYEYVVGEDDRDEYKEWNTMSADYGSFDSMRDFVLDTFGSEDMMDGFDNYRFEHDEGELSERAIRRNMR